MIGALAFLALLSAPQDDPEAQARALLDRAEELVRTEHFGEARALYKKLADRFGETEAGKTGARRSLPSAYLGFADLVRHGPSSNRVDVVLMGEGYTLEHQKAFDNLAEDVPRLFERHRTFREYWSYLNFLRASLVSADDGVDGFGREYDTALDARTLATFAGHVGLDPKKVKEVLTEIPGQDGLAIVYVKLGVLGTGGGGTAVIGGMSATTTVHEWGHAFGGLSDEYDAQQSHGAGSGPMRSGINVSATEDPKQVPWAHWIAAKHPSVGVYEGAAQRVRGAWRPTASGCVMQSGEFFCPVCQEALVLRIYSIVDPVEECSPAPPPEGIREPIVVKDEPQEIRVRVMRPASHDLDVRWWVLPEARWPESTGGFEGPASGRGARPDERSGTGSGTGAPRPGQDKPRARFGDRRDRGPLAPIPDQPTAIDRGDDDGVHVFKLKRTELEPGKYKVICRVRDTTRLSDEKWPWVLKDEHGLLESERVWWVRVPERP